jgi:hypothetical protein
MSVEAMKQALEALETDFVMPSEQYKAEDEAIKALRAAIEQAEKQEPVAKMREMLEVQGRDGNWNYDAYMQGMYNGMEFMVALAEGRDPVFRDAPEKWLYIPPQRSWQGLTDEDIYSIIESNVPPKQLTSIFEMAEWVAKVVEAKLKEKNA